MTYSLSPSYISLGVGSLCFGAGGGGGGGVLKLAEVETRWRVMLSMLGSRGGSIRRLVGRRGGEVDL